MNPLQNFRNSWLTASAMSLVALGSAHAEPPDAIKFPFVVWDVNFDSQEVGAVPRGLSKAEVEKIQQADPMAGYPRRTYDALGWNTRTRWVTIQDSLGELQGKPLVFVFEEDRPPAPHYGPQMLFRLPSEISVLGGKYRLSLDLAKDNLAQAGGFSLGDVAQVSFREEGWIVANKNQIGLFKPGVPIHFDLLIDAREKTVTFTIDGDESKAVTMPWIRSKGSFTGLRLDGYQPGGFARGKGRIAFDNIKLTIEATLP